LRRLPKSLRGRHPCWLHQPGDEALRRMDRLQVPRARCQDAYELTASAALLKACYFSGVVAQVQRGVHYL